MYVSNEIDVVTYIAVVKYRGCERISVFVLFIVVVSRHGDLYLSKIYIHEKYNPRLISIVYFVHIDYIYRFKYY